MSSFWEKKFTQQKPQPQVPQRPSNLPPSVLPYGMALDQKSATEHYLARLREQQAPVQQQAQEIELNPNGEIDMATAIHLWKGDKNGAAGADVGPCPNCGGPRYMAPANSRVTTQNGVVYAAPECFDCGYPRQQGSIGSAAVISKGNAQVSRQAAPPPPPPGSLESLRG